MWPFAGRWASDATPRRKSFDPSPAPLGRERRSPGFGAEVVADFLVGTGPVTRTWHFKYALKGFFQFVVSRGHMDKAPLPTERPKCPSSFVPYIYSHEELRRLLEAIPSFQRFPCRLEPPTLRAILLLLYGAGLRRGEALDWRRQT